MDLASEVTQKCAAFSSLEGSRIQREQNGSPLLMRRASENTFLNHYWWIKKILFCLSEPALNCELFPGETKIWLRPMYWTEEGDQVTESKDWGFLISGKKNYCYFLNQYSKSPRNVWFNTENLYTHRYVFAFLFIDLSNPPSEGRVVYLLSCKPLYFLSIQRVLDIFRGLLSCVQDHFLLRKDIPTGRIAFCSLRLANLLSCHYL